MEAHAPDRRRIPWTGLALAFGLALRLYHYLRDPSVWHDEAALILNVLGKNFGELLGPLRYYEAAPPLFLWAERVVALALGDGTFALRLLPFLASCLALLLTAHVARRILPAAAVPWAVLLLAGSDRILWHGCEAKPYAPDVLATAAVLALYVDLRGQSLYRQCLVHSLLAPAIIWMCFPGCFLYGGLLVALLPALARERRLPSFLAYALLVLTVFASFYALATGPIRAQRHAMMDACWLGQFPDWQHPWSVPAWTFFSTLDVGRYCFEPTGHALALLAVVGAFLLWKRGERALATLLTVPLILALAASLLHAYPYGGARVEVYAAPALALLAAASVPSLHNWLGPRRPWATLALAVLFLAPAAQALYHVVEPWPRAECDRAADFVLRERRPDDAVAANHWEHVYYFRHLGSAFRPLEEFTPGEANRLWVVATGATDDERRRALVQAPAGWRPVLERPFYHTVVVLLERP